MKRRGAAEHGHALPGPTIWPAVLAAGVSLLAASLATSLFLAVGGLVLCGFALWGWVQDLLWAPADGGQGAADRPPGEMGERHG